MYLLRQNDDTDYNYKEYYLDTKEELSQIETAYCCPGSIAYIINSTDVYILNTNKQWVIQGGSGGSGGGSAKLQAKEVTITENTSTSITPDGGFDGLSSVNVITNVASDSTEAINLIDEINGEVI